MTRSVPEHSGHRDQHPVILVSQRRLPMAGQHPAADAGSEKEDDRCREDPGG